MGRLHTVPSKLSKMPTRLAAVNPDSWRGAKQGSTARGYGYRWQQYRLRFLAEHPLCVMCEREGRVEAATVVDHIVPHQGDDQLFWDGGNHQALCKAHHDGDKARAEAADRQAARLSAGRAGRLEGQEASDRGRTEGRGGSKVGRTPET